MIKVTCRILLTLTLITLFSTSSLLAAGTTLEQPAFKSGKVTITFDDAKLKTMTETPFAVSVIGDTGITVSDAKLSMSLDMPAMPMPPNNPSAEWADDAYRGIAIFTMAGAWQVTINIQRPGYDQEQVVFDIEQVMMK